MADFIYLLQNRLTPAQWRALEGVREAARAHGMPVFLVGGAVRDLSTGSPVRDLDFAVQGDPAVLVPDLEAAGATVTGRNAVLSSVYLKFRGGVRGELGPSLTVTYPKPGQPEAQPAPILDDLRRRDFTANAMAVSLNEGSYGLLLDPLNGTADIENRELRLVSAYGFVEQPALLLRAARLGERLGWSLEERTANRYQNGKEEAYIQALPEADRGYELEELFHEEYPLTILEHLETEGWGEVLFPALRSADGDRAGLDHVRELVGQLEGQGIHPDPSAVFFPYITAKLSDKDREALKALLARPGFVQQIETIEARAKELATQLTSKGAALPSESWRLLMSADPELVLWLAVHTRTGAVQTKIKAFLKDWPQMRQKIPYALMQEMRITPDLPEYEKLIDDLFFALMDGKLDTPEATRAFLEPFSPPAPPQVAVRRRPAKSARSRSKKVAEDAVPEPVEDLDAEETDQDSEESDASDAADGPDSDTQDDRSNADTADRGDEDEEDDEDEPALPKPASPAKKAAGKAKTQAEPTDPAPEKSNSSPGIPPAKSAPPLQPASSASAGSSPEVAATRPLPVDAKSAAKKSAPVKVVAKAPAKVVVKEAPEVPTKSAAKSGEKLAAKATGKASVKIPAKAGKAVPQKAAPVKQTAKKTVVKVAAKKTVAVKAAAKTPAKKVAAKKQPAQRGGNPVKTANKVAVKGRSGR